jgi:hypothetical protein
MTESVPKNMPELLSLIDAEWSALMDVTGKLSPVQMVTPDAGGWSPKDNLAHLMEWMRVLIYNNLGGQPVYEVMEIPREVADEWNFDTMNKILFERHQHRSADDILADLKRVYGELLAKLNSMTFEDLMKPRFPDAPEKGPFMNWVRGNSYEHFIEHGASIERVLKAGGS